MDQTVPATLESRLAVLRNTSEQRLPQLAELNQRLFSDLRATVVPIAAEVGDAAPEIELPSALTGRPVRLSWLLDAGPVVLAFYRGHWCPYSQVQLQGLQQAYGAIRALGAELVFVGPETLESTARVIEKFGGAVPLLADTEGAAMDAYRVAYTMPAYLRAEYEPIGFPGLNPDTAWRLPITATFLIDQLGVIRARHLDPDYTRRMEPADIVACLRRMAAG